ncbi:MAG: hypothetical protein K9M11_01395 [Candidatus Pacebacteria bacterium]|nr:hypothetical protein [Candidatus Paceibacterota bacterium]
MKINKVNKPQHALADILDCFEPLMGVAVVIILMLSFTGCSEKAATSPAPAKAEALQPMTYPLVLQRIYTTEDANPEVVSDVNVGEVVTLKDRFGIVTNFVTIDGVQITYTADEQLKAGDKAQVVVYKVIRSIGSVSDSTTGGRILTNEKIGRVGVIKLDEAKRAILADLLDDTPSKNAFGRSNLLVPKVATVPAATLQTTPLEQK